MLRKDLLTKIGEKDTDTPYTRLIEAVFDQIPDLSEAEKDTLRAIATKRLRRSKTEVKDNPARGDERGVGDHDGLAQVERTLLGERRYQQYRAGMAAVFAGTGP
jgi:hypothetical protein